MESLAEIERRHEKELEELAERVKQMLKGAKKSTRAQVEAEAVQLQFDLKARHRDELEEAEERGVSQEPPTAEKESQAAKQSREAEIKEEEERIAAQKKAKAKKKQDKRSQKEKEREEKKSEIQNTVGSVESLRSIEISGLKEKLEREKLQIRDIPSDGHCLYRAIADQLSLILDHGDSHDHHKGKKGKIATQSTPVQAPPDFKELRLMAADHIRRNANEFAPFIGVLPEDEEFEVYCQKVASETAAEWGGQLEIRALSECLQRPIYVYSASAPVVVMGEEHSTSSGQKGENVPIRLSYHRHLFALGEHYNSLVPLCC